MRIALFSWESLHSIVCGGLAPHVTELAAALQRRGHEVHVFTRKRDDQPGEENILGVQYHRIGYIPNDDIIDSMDKMCNSMSWAFGETSNYLGGFDIAHAHDWMTCKAMVQAKNEHGTRCLFTFHSTETGRLLGHGGKKSAEITAWEAEASFVADRVIAVSNFTKTEVQSLYSLPEQKVWFITNGQECSRYDGMLDNPADIKAKYDIGPLDPVLLFVGRLQGGAKGADLIVEAAPSILGMHDKTKMIFVGDGDSKMHCDHRAKELGVGHACRFLGPKNGMDLVNLYKMCDAVIVPSRYEPFGLTVTEAWAAGKVVIASDQVGAPVQHEHDSWVVSCTPEGVSWGVARVLEDFGRARKMGANGREKAAYQLSWDFVASETEKAYTF